MKIVIASDHGGLELKNLLFKYLREDLGLDVQDFGTYSKDSVDYPDFAYLVAQGVSSKEFDIGIVVDGAGIGSSMAANKVKGVRAALCFDAYTANNAREHNNANVLTLGSMTSGPGVAKDIVRTFITTPFAGGRHERRVDKIMAIEGEFFK